MCSPGLHRDEKTLVELAQQGDSTAFGEIYDRNVSTVYQYAYTLLGNRSEAEDLTAEAFLRALQAIRHYRWTGRPVSAWLLTIARNLGINQLRRNQRTKEILRLVPATTPRDPPEVGSAPDVDIQECRRAILSLGPVDRDVIILRFVLGLDYPQVAQVLGKSVNNVRVMQYRALRRLREKLAPAESADRSAAPSGEEPQPRTRASSREGSSCAVPGLLHSRTSRTEGSHRKLA